MTTVILVDILIVAILLTADLLSKHFVESFLLSRGGSYEVIKNILTFRYSRNAGAAFGIFENSRVFLSVFVGIILLALIGFMVYHIIKRKYKEKGGIFLHVSLSFILAGGLGNLVDRVAFGYVRDFIDYTFLYTLFDWNFAICNLADVFLTVGVIMIVIYLIYAMVLESKKEKEKAVPIQSSENTLPNETPSEYIEENHFDEPAESVSEGDEEARKESND